MHTWYQEKRREFHVQLSHSSLQNNDDNDNRENNPPDNNYPKSYQMDGGELGPGMTKILEKQRLDQDGLEMQRRTRLLYVLLGIVLLVVYWILIKRHFFEKHNIHLPDTLNISTLDASWKNMTESTSSTTEYGDAVEMLGSSHHHSKKKNILDLACDDGGYSKRTLQRAYELPFASLFKDTKGQKKYEASDVILVDGYAYAVCDNSWAISKFGDDLRPFSPDNQQIGQPDREEEDSGFEALFYDTGTFYVLRESVYHEEGEDYHAIIEELIMGSDDYDIKSACPSEFVFEGDSKGFEGVLSLRDTSNELVVLGLCEGNHCSESRKFDTGHGVFVAMKKGLADDGTCEWKTIKKVKIPSSADFRDYSAATIDETGRVVISTQEDSAIWIGQLEGLDPKTGLWDLENLQFDDTQGTVYTFPKNDDCEIIYCNIEGIHWINDEMIIAVSDKMKSKGKQDFRCFDKDQSVHVFVLP